MLEFSLSPAPEHFSITQLKNAMAMCIDDNENMVADLKSAHMEDFMEDLCEFIANGLAKNEGGVTAAQEYL